MNLGEKQVEMPSYDDSLVIKLGLALIFIVFVVLGGWIAFAPLASSSVAMGKVSADLEKKTIQHLEGGKVAAIYVKDGDRVKKDQLLLKLQDVQIKAQLDILLAQYQDARVLISRLSAQKNEAKTVTFESDISDETAKVDQQNIFITTLKTIKNEKVISKNKILQLKSKIDGLTSVVESKKHKLESLLEEKIEWNELYEQRLVDKQRIREIRREVLMIEGAVSQDESQIVQLREQIQEIKNQQFLREDEFRKTTLEEYIKVKSLIFDIKSKIITSQDMLNRTSIRSPISGTVVGFSMHTVGGVINPSNPILEIIPKDSKLLVLAEVQTQDIDKVRVGLVADIMFSAFNLKKVHVIRGKVVHISADIFMNEATGMPYYEAKIEVTTEGVEVLNKNNFILVPGMPADVMIQLGNRSALSYLVQPFTSMLKGSFNEE